MIKFVRLSSVVSLVVLTSSSVASAQQFEGAITMRMTGGPSGAPLRDIEFLVSNGNVRVDIASPAGAMTMLRLAAESKTYMLMESQRMYMDVSTVTADVATSAANAPGDAKIVKTGRSETIAGYTCEHVIIEATVNNSPQKVDVCMTNALGTVVIPMGAPTTGGTTEWQRQLEKYGGFSLKMIADEVSLEVTKIEKKRVSNELFRIPSDYTKMDMPRRP